jgi:quinol monooxygenase YgiN
MIHVIALVTAHPGQREKLLEAFRGNVPNVHAEDGCIEYAAVIDLEPGPAFQAKLGPDAFFVIEKWRDLAALQAHGTGPVMKAYGAKTKEFIAGRAIHVLQGI